MPIAQIKKLKPDFNDYIMEKKITEINKQSESLNLMEIKY